MLASAVDGKRRRRASSAEGVFAKGEVCGSCLANGSRAGSFRAIVRERVKERDVQQHPYKHANIWVSNLGCMQNTSKLLLACFQQG